MAPIVVRAFRTVLKSLRNGLEESVNQKKNRHHPDYSFAEISKNTKKSPGDLKRLAVT